MSEEKNNINNSQEKDKDKNEEKINLSYLNNFLNLQNNNLSPLNLDKDQLFQSFLLFQNFLSMNPNLIKDNKNIENLKNEEKEIKTNENILKNSKLNESKILNDSKNNTEEDNKIENENKSIQNENKPTQNTNTNTNTNEKRNDNKNVNINIYDEIPIKPSGYNFMELLEKTLANEENNKNENVNNYNNKNQKVRHFNKKNIKKNMNNVTNDTSSSMYNNISEPNISKENKYFKIKEIYENGNKSFEKKDEEISSINNEDINNKDYKKTLLINDEKIKEEIDNLINEDDLKDISPKKKYRIFSKY